MHRHDAVLDLLEERDWIEPADDSVGWVVLHAEVWRFRQGVEQRQERLFLLGELRIQPVTDLVVVLEAQDDVAAGGVVQRPDDALGGASHTVGDGQIGILLTAQRAAVLRADSHRQVDGALLPLYLPQPLIAVGMREVGREAEHRCDLSGGRHRVHHGRDVALLVAGKELVVVLDAFPAKRRGVVDPAHVAALARDQLIEVALGEDGDAGCGQH